MADRNRLTTELHATLKNQLQTFDGREDRLLDLAADGTHSRSKILERIKQVATGAQAY